MPGRDRIQSSGKRTVQNRESVRIKIIENEQGAVAFTGGSLFSAVRLTAKICFTGECAPKSSLQMFSLAEKIRFSQKIRMEKIRMEERKWKRKVLERQQME